MSASHSFVAVLLDPDRVRVFSAAGELIATESWTPEAPDAAFERLRAVIAPSATATLVLGLGFLEVARPELPPLDVKQRRALLLRDADRYFPTGEAIAVSVTGDFACAVRADQLQMWIAALGRICTIRGSATVLECLARAGAHGPMAMSSGMTEAATASFERGTLTAISRNALPSSTARVAGAAGATTLAELDLRLVGRGAAAVADAPLEAMLLDGTLASKFGGARRRRWMQSAAAFLLAAAAFAWSADRLRTRELDATNVALRELNEKSTPARLAAVRLERARAELAMLSDTMVSPDAVLAELGTALPRDAFVQRLEWDGTLWRIEGSALDAPRIVPLLDANPMFRDVRIVAASTRFLDAGRQRESFSMSFRTRDGGSRDRQ
ncbi:MAG TPA: PilN domain-containing protein [Gemmatimonas sp.]|nr:PilN domain-containing protein [Gemmatimonas sp.]